MPMLRPRIRRPDMAPDGRIMAASPNDDKALGVLIKSVPVEVIAFYQCAVGAVPPVNVGMRFWLTIVFAGLTPFWIGYATKNSGGRVAWRQSILSCVAFIFWISGTQEGIAKYLIPSWETWMGSVSLALGAVIVAILEGILFKSGVRQN